MPTPHLRKHRLRGLRLGPPGRWEIAHRTTILSLGLAWKNAASENVVRRPNRTEHVTRVQSEIYLKRSTPK